MHTLSRPIKVAFTTLGCRTNQHDTAEMQALLQDDGFDIVDSRNPADVYVINTCTVTARSDYHSRLAVKKSLAINEDALVVFTGCYAQMNPEEAAGIAGTDILLGNANKLEIANAIREKVFGPEPWRKNEGPADIIQSDIHAEDRVFRTIPVSGFMGKTKAFIKVQTGCDERCSFCTVVLARGRSISESGENVLRNVQHAIDSGYKEITLTGVNMGTWGMDVPNGPGFSSLVRDILRLPGEFRVRLSSINPMEIDDDLIQLIADDDRLCPHLHVPLQSGDDTLLRAMRRNYNATQYRSTVERIIDKVPNIALGADVIVGFPGETDAMFENTYRLIDDLPFTYLHVFSYSAREGTDAASLKDTIKNETKKQRNQQLTQLAKQKGQSFRSRFQGKRVHVLVESERDTTTQQLKGHSEQFIPVTLEGGDDLMNRIVPVQITEVSENRVTGCARS